MKRVALLILICQLAAACTSINVKPIDSSIRLTRVCIQENPKVIVPDFVQIVRDGFDRHGIATTVYSGEVPNTCEYVLTYTALRNWDLAPYLYHAELRIEKAGRQVAYGEYHLKGKGGLDPTKWAGTRSKMDPVIDMLLLAQR